MMQTRQDMNVTTLISVIYDKIIIEFSLPIGKDKAYHDK